MGINGLGQVNTAELQKLLAAKKSGGQVKTEQKSVDMTRDGSIFNIAKSQSTVSTSQAKNMSATEIANHNKQVHSLIDKLENNPILKHSQFGKEKIENLKSQLIEVGDNKKSSNTEETSTQQDYSVEGGKAAASEGKSEASDTSSMTKETEKNTKEVNSLSSDSKKLGRNSKKDANSLRKTLNNTQKSVDKNNQKIQKSMDGIENLSTEIDSISAEIETLSAEEEQQKYSVYSLNISGDTGAAPQTRAMGANQGGLLASAPQTQTASATPQSSQSSASSSSDSRSQKITQLNTKMNSAATKITKYNGKITKLQTRNNKSIKMMDRTSKKMVKSFNKTNKTLETNQKTTDKIINVAGKVEEIAGYTAMGGQAVQLVAKGMRSAGQAMMSNTFTAAAGAALVSASVPVESTGVVMETVGNYGQCAAQLTKSACYAADGNIAGALSSVASAAMTGASAVKGTKTISSGFENIKGQAAEAMQKGAAKAAANETVKNQVGEMSKKQIQETYGMTKGQMKDIAYNNSLNSIQQSTQGMDYKGIKNAFNNNTNNVMSTAKTSASAGISTSTTNIKAAGELAASGTTSKAAQKASKEAMKKAAKAEAAGNAVATTASKAKTSETLLTIGNSLQTASSYFAQSTPSTTSTSGKKRSVTQRTNPAKFQQMMANRRVRHSQAYAA